MWRNLALALWGPVMDFELIRGEGPVSMGDSFFREARARSQEMIERDPVVGDVVHFWDDTACRAAIVTYDGLDAVDLTVFHPAGEHVITRHANVGHDEAKARDTWHWPEMGQ